jgi:outer membrane protein OmpA-like peptidoglycan-associated protein
MVKKLTSIIIAGMLVTVMSCATTSSRQESGTYVGAGVGAGVGALIGQAIGHDTGSTLLGAGLGAVVGGIAGNQIGAYMDDQERELRDAISANEARTNDRIAAAEAASVRRSQDVLTATFRSELLFDYDSAVLKPGGYIEIGRVARVLNRYPSTTIRVDGHTDSRGNAVYNQSLSERRAEAVKNALIQNNVDPRRIHAIGYGESQPVSSSDAQNRRVEIVITPVRAQG